MVTMRSWSLMNPESTFSSVVFPAPVPPETRMFSRQATALCRNCSIGCGQRVALDEVVRAEPIGPEAADRQHRTVERERRDDRVDARAVRQPGVDHRARLVDAAADRADDALDDLHHVRVVAEDQRGLLQPSLALDVDLVVAVDEDVGDRRVAQQRLERTEAEDLVEDLDDQRVALELAEGRRLRFDVQHRVDEAANLRLGVLAADARQSIEMEPVQQVLVHPPLQALVLGMPRVALEVA